MAEPTKYSILIIDDEDTSINVLAHILRKDYTIYTAKDGKTGYEIAQEFMPDLILLDIIMPEADGHAVLSDLKASDKTRYIPVIFVTGLDTDADAVDADDFIRKPFSAAAVKAKVEKQIRRIRHIR